MSERLKTALEEAKEVIRKQNALLEHLTTEPHVVGRILEIAPNQKHMKVLVGSEVLQIAHPAIKPPLAAGDEVSLTSETNQFIQKLDYSDCGQVAVVRRVIDKTFCEVDFGGQSRYTMMNGKSLEIGDEVLVDNTGTIVLKKISDATKQQFEFHGNTGITWNDIGGLQDAKAALQECVELPFAFPDLFKWYNKKPMKGVELYGPPGCGKTMLAKALVTSLRNRTKASDDGFFYVKGPEILDPYVGVAEANVRKLFAKGRLHKKKHGVPGVLFVDEADAILGKRGTGISSDMEKTIVPTFLAEMDGLDDFSVVVILATNRNDILDPAIVRPGRVNRAIKVGRPNEDESRAIFELYLSKVPMAKQTTTAVTFAARNAAKLLFSGENVIYEITRKGGITEKFTLGHLASCFDCGNRGQCGFSMFA